MNAIIPAPHGMRAWFATHRHTALESAPVLALLPNPNPELVPCGPLFHVVASRGLPASTIADTTPGFLGVTVDGVIPSLEIIEELATVTAERAGDVAYAKSYENQHNGIAGNADDEQAEERERVFNAEVKRLARIYGLDSERELARGVVP